MQTAEKTSHHSKPSHQAKTTTDFFSPATGRAESPYFMPLIQAKLKVGQSGDKFEKEADATADKVTAMPDSNIRRQAEPKEEEKPVQKVADKEEEKPVQKAAGKEEEQPVQKMADKEEDKPVQKAAEKEEDKPVQKMADKEEDKPVQKAAEKEEDMPVQKMADKEEDKPVQKAADKEEEKPVQKAADKEEEKPVQKAADKEEEKPVQKAADKSMEPIGPMGDNLRERLQVTKSGGTPLPEEARSYMEPRFGADLRHVRIHTGGEAVQLSKDLSAQAFTHGSHVYFNEGKYNPGSNEGKKLLAHELTHVLQQTGTKTLRRKPVSNATAPIAHSTTPLLQLKAAAAPAPASSTEDPAFAKVIKRIQGKAKADKTHEPASKKSKQAQDASVPPANEVASKAKDRQTQKMDAQQPGEFNAAAFKAMLMEKINASAPENMEETQEYKSSGKADAVKSDVAGAVGNEKKQAGAAIENTTKQAPDSSGIAPKDVSALPPTPATSGSTNVGAKDAAPKPKSPDEVSLEANKTEMEGSMQDGDMAVTDHQLAASGEPKFQKTLEKKNEAKADADNAPNQYRKDEKNILGKAQTDSQKQSNESLSQMHGGRRRLMRNMTGSQVNTKSKDELERKRVSDTINGFYEQTKTDVEAILLNLDTQANAMFDSAATYATDTFQNYVDDRMARYKAKRYSGWTGGAKWAWDKLTGMPDEVNVFYIDGRNIYLSTMDKLIDKIANFVAFELSRAKTRIAKGKADIAGYVAGLKGSLKKFGTEALNDIQDKFSELEQSVNNKQEDLADALATKYKENLSKVDTKIAEMKAANRGLVDKVIDGVKEIINTLRELKKILSDALAKAASVFHIIMDDPGQFMSNFFDGIKLGINNFRDNFETHIKEGLMDWAFGEMAADGVERPDKFDAKGIFGMILQVLGLTKANLRKKAVKLFGEKAVKAAETGVEIIKDIVTEGPSALFRHMQDAWDDLKEGLQATIKEFLITKIIIAGMKFIAGLLIPGAGLIKIVQLIVRAVMFFVNNAKRIALFLASIIDSVTDAALGNLSVAAGKVENALRQAIPLVISLLTTLLGISGIAGRIKGFVKRIQLKVDKGVDKALAKAESLIKKAGSALGFGKKDKEGPDSGLAVKQKAKADLVAKTTTPFKTKDDLQSVVSGVLAKYKPEGLKALNLLEKPEQKGKFLIEAVASPGEKVDEAEVLADGKDLKSPHPVGTAVKFKYKSKPDSSWAHGKIVELLEGGEKGAASHYPKGEVVAKIELDAKQNVGKHELSTTNFSLVSKILPTGNSGWVLDDEKPAHDQYKPKNVKKSKVEADGSYTLAYDTMAGTTFTVEVGGDGLVKSMTGTNLRLKRQVGIDNRGVTERSEGFVSDEELNAAHLIADQFLGSGYKDSANLVTTSSHFNQVVMGNIEKKIAAKIRKEKATSFDMSLSVEWGELMNDAVLSRIMKQLPDGERDAVRGDVEAFIARVNPTFKRVMNVEYSVVINGVSLPLPDTGPDAWLGLK
ncbi:MAG: DUF4157 domain-containing protein [Saprospiraceae bacterium]